jgi:putative membrane protein
VIVLGELIAAGGAYLWCARRVRRWPAARTLAFAAGLVALGLALIVLDGPADRRLSAHMAQHLVLVLVAAPLLVLGSPLAIALRATGARASRALGWPLIAHPLAGWCALSVVLAASHLTGVYDAAVRHPVLHVAEHVAYVTAAVLFWRPVLGADPVPHRPGTAGRVLYLLSAAGPMAIVGVAMAQSTRPWYAAYAGPGALSDQHAAGVLMWIGAGLAMGVITLVVAWSAIVREHRRQVAYEEATA